jgi:hypothetical protein
MKEETMIENQRTALTGTRVRLVPPRGPLGMMIARDPLTPGQERMLREIRPDFDEWPKQATKMKVSRIFASRAFMFDFDTVTSCEVLPDGQDVLFANA